MRLQRRIRSLVVTTRKKCSLPEWTMTARVVEARIACAEGTSQPLHSRRGRMNRETLDITIIGWTWRGHRCVRLKSKKMDDAQCYGGTTAISREHSVIYDVSAGGGETNLLMVQIADRIKISVSGNEVRFIGFASVRLKAIAPDYARFVIRDSCICE